MVSYHKFNERKQTNNIIEHLKQGKILSLISDAGTPLLSDPGQILLKECIKKDIKVVPIPGASSITSAMSVSGFKDKFLFYGFLPKSDKELDKVLETLSTYQFSQIFFIPSLKINFYIKKFKKYFLNREIMIAKEITKIHESFYRDHIENIEAFNHSFKGELTVVISEAIVRKNTFNEEK